MALTTITTGPAAVLDGTASIPATALDPTCAVLCFQYDIAQYATTGSISISADLSQDGGTTWKFLGSVTLSDSSFIAPAASSRFPSGWGGLCVPIPAGSNNQVRATLTTTVAMVTAMQIVQSTS